MLPILIMPDGAPEFDDEIALDVSDSETDLADSCEIDALWQAMPQAEKRTTVPLGPWVEIRHSIAPVTEHCDAAPASLQECDRLLKLLLRRKADSLGRRQWKELRRVMNTTGLAPVSIATLSPETATWLLWAMSWRGVSSPRQLVSPPLHAPTLVVQWWTSMPTSLCFGPGAPLLRVFADCADRLYRFWRRTVKRKRASTRDALDPRMVRIKFTPLMATTNSTGKIENWRGKGSFASLVCANLTTSDSFATYGNEESMTCSALEIKTRAIGRGVTHLLPLGDTFSSLHGWGSVWSGKAMPLNGPRRSSVSRGENST